MNAKFISVSLATLSALGIAYFAGDTLLGLGDIGWLFSTQPRVLLVALVVTLVALVVAWSSIWWVSNAKSTKGFILKLLGSSFLAWAWFFFGSIYLALLRFN